jgi:hypothetical protein
VSPNLGHGGDLGGGVMVANRAEERRGAVVQAQILSGIHTAQDDFGVIVFAQGRPECPRGGCGRGHQRRHRPRGLIA